MTTITTAEQAVQYLADQRQQQNRQFLIIPVGEINQIIAVIEQQRSRVVDQPTDLIEAAKTIEQLF